ncbi:hypothetical protein [Streptomyces sp900116325]|uniref:hypothetical protein n=1 Tax=Streptomyces sp. 900116325 TaxID=3154295 RepID=UPI0033BA4D1A
MRHARGRVWGINGWLRGLLWPVRFAVAVVWLLADSFLTAEGAFLGSVFGLVARTGVSAARHAKMGAPLGP